MGSRYLTELADVVRAAGLVVTEEPGWETRARGSGGFSGGLPNHVMIHHTASGPSSDGQPDVNYMCYSADARPVANLYLSRAGEVWIMAAGATNTNGSGGDPCGTIANDSMNSSAIGIEAGNGGTGEPWPQAQQDAYVALVGALCDAYGIDVARVHSHAEWAPGRKVDPAGPSRWAASGTWDEHAFRADVTTGGPAPTPERKHRMYSIITATDGVGGTYASDMIHVRWLSTEAAVGHYQAMLTLFGFNPNPAAARTKDIQEGMYGVLIGPVPWDGARDATALAVWNILMNGWGTPNDPAWVHMTGARAFAEIAAGPAAAGLDAPA